MITRIRGELVELTERSALLQLLLGGGALVAVLLNKGEAVSFLHAR